MTDNEKALKELKKFRDSEDATLCEYCDEECNHNAIEKYDCFCSFECLQMWNITH